jgi:AraC-like DNA-binding protein
MLVDINQLAEYYAKANLSYTDIFSAKVPPGNAVSNLETTPNYCGIVIPITGCACFTINGTPYILKPGIVVHTGPSMKLDKEVIGNEAWCYARIHFQLPESEKSHFPFYNSHFALKTGINPKIIEYVKYLIKNDSKPDSISRLLCKATFIKLLEEFVLTAKKLQRDDAADIIDNAVTYINERYWEPITIERLAEEYGLTGKRFGYLFFKHVGMAPLKYLTELRMRHAKELLSTCECTITQISECIGYENPYYFSNIFKQYTGVSPSAFRKMRGKTV